MEEKILEILKKYKSPIVVYIFGSFGTERFNTESDIDIAVLWEEKLDNFKLYQIKNELIETLNREIDLIELNNTNLILIKEVIYKGKLIYVENEKKRLEFEYKSLAMYNQYIEEISIIKEKIKERGCIYGRNNIK